MFKSNESQIANFYKDRSVFITGATGFIGKVLVEKLLRSCDGVKNIYVLLRTKKGLDVRTRLDEIIDAKIFEKIRDENPVALNKLIAIEGDITKDGLGISKNDLNSLISDVSVVFHSAATVKFDEPLKIAVNYNVLGTRRLVEICHKMPKLEALIHVSTCYAYSDRKEIDEVLYSPPVSPQLIIDLVDWMDDELVNSLTPKLLGERPNTYTYTKALAESLLVNECGRLPVAIVRPSIVTASWREPLPGWVDNTNAGTGIILNIGNGLLRTLRSNEKSCIDLIPVDTVINLMIAVAWYTATQRPDSVLVYNSSSGISNKITYKEFKEYSVSTWRQYPSARIFRYPGVRFTETIIFIKFSHYFNHIIPAYIFDTFLATTGRERKMARIYEKLFVFIKALEFFSIHEWKIGTNNVLMLTNQLEGVDKQEFNFDIRQLNWSTYWKDYVLGIRRYVLKEDDSTLPKARSDLKRMYYLNKIFVLLVLCMTLYGGSRMLALEELIKNSEIVLENNDMRAETCNKSN